VAGVPASLLRGFHAPAHPLALLPWTGAPAGPGVYVTPGVAAPPDPAAPVMTVAPGVVRFAFDPELALDRLVREADAGNTRPFHSRLPIPSVLVPTPLREALLRRSLAPRLRRADVAPRWPVEPAAEDLRALVRTAAGEAGVAAPAAPFWPDGKRYAVTLSHDIDSAGAFRRGDWRPFAEAEEARGLRSAWHVCTEHLAVAGPALAELARRGHEIAWHGPVHDYRIAYLPAEAIRAHAARFRDRLAAFAPRGFRSPNFIRSAALYAGLEGVLGYDSSARDTAAELFSPRVRQGCATVFPFFHGDLLELPVTIPDDLSLRCLHGDDAAATLRVQLEKLAWIRSVGGLALCLTHPERWISMRPGAFRAYEGFLDAVAADAKAWKPLSRDVEAWWRKRSAGEA